jgi:hypothetical protein
MGGGKLKSATIASTAGTDCAIRYGRQSAKFTLLAGQTIQIDGALRKEWKVS